jgi:hypothetical protein
MISSLADMLWVFDHAGVFLSDAEVRRAQESGYNFLRAWGVLAEQYIQDDLAGYKLRPKLHYLEHLLERLLPSHENPRVLSNFASEDFMGRITAVARRQHRAVCVARTIEVYSMQVLRRWTASKSATVLFFLQSPPPLSDTAGFMHVQAPLLQPIWK